MRTKKRMVIMLLLVVTTLVAAIMLCSCDAFNGGGNNGGSSGGGNSNNNTPKDDEDVGWKSFKDDKIYSSLITGCTDVAYQASKVVVSSNKGIMTLESKMKFTFNGTDLWARIAAKYKEEAQTQATRNNLIISLDIATEETPTAENRIVSAYVFKDELYVALGSDEEGKNNKVKFSIKDFNWVDYFPIEMEKPDTTTIIRALNMGLVLNKDNKAEKRRSEKGDECRYTIDIDLDASITQTFNTVTELGLKSEIIDKVKEFIAVFYNVEPEDINEGNLPASKLVIYFETLNKLVSLIKFSFDIDLKENTMLFGGEKMVGSASIEKLTVANDYSALKIAFAEEERNKYVMFDDSIFALTIPLDEYKDGKSLNKTTLKVTTKVFQGDGKDDYVFAEYSDSTGNIQKGLYIYNNIAYFYVLKDDQYQCICSMDIVDLGRLATKTISNNLGGEQKFDGVKLLAYIINGVSMDNSGIRFSIKPNFYTVVWYNFYDMCNYVNALTEEDMMEIAGIQEFLDYVTNNEVILSLETHVSFFEIIDSNNQYVRNIIGMLGNVSDDVMLTPVAVPEE